MSPIRKLALLVSFGISAAAACAACGSGSTGGGGSGGSTTSSGSGMNSTSTGSPTSSSSGMSTTSSGSTTSSTSSGTMTIDPPNLETVKPSNGGLLLTWSLTGPCDNIEVSRKDTLHAYAVIATVPATPMSYPDPTATQNYNYTYHLRCEVGGVFSDYSSELAANPTGP